MKSDIWSMACIFAELYTGEMFFSTHENVEHLALMEKTCGPFPYHMAEKSQKEFKQCFNFHQSESDVKRQRHRLGWPHIARRKENLKNYADMLTLDVSYCFIYICIGNFQTLRKPQRAPSFERISGVHVYS